MSPHGEKHFRYSRYTSVGQYFSVTGNIVHYDFVSDLLDLDLGKRSQKTCKS